MPEFDEADEKFFRSIVPDPRAMPTGILAVVGWIDPDTGARRFKFHTNSDDSISEILGMIEMAKMDLLSRNYPNLLGHPDPDEP